jgi:hypothetical protein
MVTVLFLPKEQKNTVGTEIDHVCNRLHLGYICVGPLGAQPILPRPNLVGAYPDTWLSLPESRVWRCGQCVGTCSKHVAQVWQDAFIIFIYYTLLNP